MQERMVFDFNDGWRFQKLTKKSGLAEAAVELADYADGDWERIALPHTWNAVDGADGRSGVDEGGEHYYRGLGGYRKRFYFSAERYAGRRVYLEFGGANTVAELFVNGMPVGRHEGGYAAFRFDITGYIRYDLENVIAVKVNNAPADYIAPITDQGDFTKMGGLYRDVKLLAVHPVHIALRDCGSSGIYVTPVNISEEHADIRMNIRLENDADTAERVTVNAEILDGQGNAVASGNVRAELSANGKGRADMCLPLAHPVLWNGIKNPYRYRASITVSKGEDILDAYVQSFGVRTYRIDPEKGFFLNGNYVDLRGVNYHQDSYESGWAMKDAERERDYAMMLRMGCTSVRMAHYQHAAYEYELCDRLGLTVWTELGIVNKMSADESGEFRVSERFVTNAGQQLTELIRQNYNHPSIIVWGISNELYQMTDQIYQIYMELNRLARAEDETRLTAFADAQFWGRFLELPGDVVGYNRYFGWYREAGAAEAFGAWLDEYHTKKESRPICVSEYGGGAAVSQHKDQIVWESDIDPWGGRHYENYQSAMHEKIWAQFAARPYLWGKYVWCMFDFASDGREEGDTKGQNDKGLVTRERVPKDSFYFYKSVWNAEPMVHLTEQRFFVRPCRVPVVKAYANARRVELFVNGISCKSIRRAELAPENSTVFCWENIEILAGVENQVVVRAYFEDGLVLESAARWKGNAQ